MSDDLDARVTALDERLSALSDTLAASQPPQNTQPLSTPTYDEYQQMRNALGGVGRQTSFTQQAVRATNTIPQKPKAEKALTPTQQKQAAAEQRQARLDQAGAAVWGSFQNADWFANGSDQLRQAAIKHYREVTLPDFVQKDPELRNDPTLAADYTRAINQALNTGLRELNKLEAARNPEAGKADDFGNRVDALVHAAVQGYKTLAMGWPALKAAFSDARRDTHRQEKASALKYVDDQIAATQRVLSAQAEAGGDTKPAENALARLVDERNRVEADFDARGKQLDKDLVKTRIAAATDYLTALKAFNEANKDAEASNALIRELHRREAELQEVDPDGFILGLFDNNHAFMQLATKLSEQTPQFAAIALAGLLTSGVGITSAGLGLGALAAASGQMQDVLDMPLDTLKQNAEFRDTLARAKDENAARVLFGLASLSTQEGRSAIAESALLESVTEQLGPGALLSRAGLAPKLTKFINDHAGKKAGKAAAAIGGAVSSATEEFIAESGQTAIQNLAATQLYDPDRPITEGAWQSGAAGAILGAGLAVPGAIRETMADEATPAVRGPETAETATQGSADTAQESAGVSAETGTQALGSGGAASPGPDTGSTNGQEPPTPPGGTGGQEQPTPTSGTPSTPNAAPTAEEIADRASAAVQAALQAGASPDSVAAQAAAQSAAYKGIIDTLSAVGGDGGALTPENWQALKAAVDILAPNTESLPAVDAWLAKLARAHGGWTTLTTAEITAKAQAGGTTNGTGQGSSAGTGGGPGSATGPQQGPAPTDQPQNPPATPGVPPQTPTTGSGGSGGTAAGPATGTSTAPSPAATGTGSGTSDNGTGDSGTPATDAPAATGTGGTGGQAGAGTTDGAGAAATSGSQAAGSGDPTISAFAQRILADMRADTALTQEWNEIYNSIYKTLTDQGTNPDVAAYDAVYYMRLVTMLSRVTGVALSSVLKLQSITVNPNSRDLSKTATGVYIHSHPLGVLARSEIVLRESNDPVTFTHEVAHAFQHNVCDQRLNIAAQVKAGNKDAIEFDRQWRALAKAIEVRGDPYDFNAWTHKPVENFAVFVENLATDTKQPNAALQALAKPGSPLYEAIRTALARVTKTIQELVQTLGLAPGAEKNSTFLVKKFRKAKLGKSYKGYIYAYTMPAIQARAGVVPEAVKKFYNFALAEKYSGVIAEAANLGATPVELGLLDYYIGLQEAAYITRANVSPATAHRIAEGDMLRTLDLAEMLPDDAVGEVIAERHREALETSYDLPLESFTDDPNGPYTMGAQAGTDTALAEIRLMAGTESPDTLYDAQLNEPEFADNSAMRGDIALPIETAPTAAQDQADTELLADAIIDTVNEGATDPVQSPTNLIKRQPWFNAWFAQGGIMSENGTPRLLYTDGFTCSSDPTVFGTNGTVTYARENNYITAEEQLANLPNMSATTRKTVAALFRRLQRDTEAGKPVRLNTNASMMLQGLGISFHITAGGRELWMPAWPAEDIAVTAWSAEQARTLPPKDDVTTITLERIDPIPDGSGATLAILDNLQANDLAVQQARATLAAKQADLAGRQYQLPQRVTWWTNVATWGRRLAAPLSDLHTWWVQTYAPQGVEADSSPAYSALQNLHNNAKGAASDMTQLALEPLYAWVAQQSNQRTLDPQALLHDIGLAQTLLHTIEAAPIQYATLQQTLSEAYASADPVRIKEAEDALLAYTERQKGTPGVIAPLFGGRSVAECETLLNELEDKYGKDLMDEGVRRMTGAYQAAVQYLVQKGVYSADDVRAFGAWRYYCGFQTEKNAQTQNATDALALAPKMNYRRDGSYEPARDAWTNLGSMIRRGANFVAAQELGITWKEAYDRLLRTGHTYDVHLGPYQKITFAEGLAIVPKGLLDHWAQNDTDREVRRKAQSMVQAAPITVRLTEEYTDPETDQSSTRSVAYYILFDPNIGSVNAGIYAHLNDSLRQLFRRSDKAESNILWLMRKGTSGLASTFTTYTGFFPPMNAIRDFWERTAYMSGHKFRKENGTHIDGLRIAGRMLVSLANVPMMFKVMAATASGKYEHNTALGRRLDEFRSSGVMESASIANLLDRDTADLYALLTERNPRNKAQEIIQATGGRLAQLPGAQATASALRALRTFCRTWSAMWYALPAFAQFNAMRDCGIGTKDAAADVIRRMDMRQGYRLLQSFFPFTPSIGQTAIQIASYFGLSTESFGHASGKAARRQAIKNWAIFSGISIATTAALMPLIASALGDGDEDKGYKILDDIPIGALTYVPIPLDDEAGAYLKLPLGFGPALFAYQMGATINRFMRGVVSTGAYADLVSSYINNISPLGGPTYDTYTLEQWFGKLSMTITPMLAVPLVQSAMNKNYFGGTIIPDTHGRKHLREADSVLHGESNNALIWRDIAQGWQEYTTIDVHPATVRHLITSYLAAPLRGLWNAVIGDERVSHPMYADTRAYLGDSLMALGASSWVGTAGNIPRNLYYHAGDYYDTILRETGLGIELASTGTGYKKADWRQALMLRAGFTAAEASDVLLLAQAESALTKLQTAYNEKAKALLHTKKIGEFDLDAYRLLTESFFVDQANAIENCTNNLSIYQSGAIRRYSAGDMPAAEQIAEALEWAKQLRASRKANK